ncbi:unnamed protein product [Periconia digitata]|uniref:DUF7703 domain-containing protein n=1 Tax=Periconia digitata TaxID=1303443 RepID=A0A9W4XRR7_9PLEO|nr:unnamed protein product [Periconia digitata]
MIDKRVDRIGTSSRDPTIQHSTWRGAFSLQCLYKHVCLIVANSVYAPLVHPLSYPVAILLACCMSIAVYNVIEITVLIFATFKKRRGLYFKCLLVAAWSIPFHVAGHTLKLYRLTQMNTLYNTLILVGWIGMVTGQSIVLYTRVHLLFPIHKRRVRWILYMIIFDAITCHVPGIVLVYGSSDNSHGSRFAVNFNIYEIVQMTTFTLQELIISGLYVYRTFKLLNGEINYRGPAAVSMVRHLLMVNIIIILLELSLLSTIYTGHYEVETAYKPAVYSIKLKLEFPVLDDLVNLVKAGGRLGPAKMSIATPKNDTTPGPRATKPYRSFASLPTHYQSGVLGAARPKEVHIVRRQSCPLEQDTQMMSRGSMVRGDENGTALCAFNNARNLSGTTNDRTSSSSGSRHQISFRDIV